MVQSERMLKWLIRFYPPLFFQRIWVLGFDKGFRGVQVKINKSIFNKNFNNAIFGGTLFSATDPFYPVLFYQVLTAKGYNIIAWSKSSAIQFLKPCKKAIHFNVSLDDDDIAECEQVLNTVGKFTKNYPIELYDRDGQHCVSVITEIYVRLITAETEKDSELTQ